MTAKFCSVDLAENECEMIPLVDPRLVLIKLLKRKKNLEECRFLKSIVFCSGGMSSLSLVDNSVMWESDQRK